MLMIFGHQADERGATAVWRGTRMVGHRKDGLTCSNRSVSTSEGRRAEKEGE